MNIVELLGQISVLTGAGIFVVAAIGMYRLADPYMRISAVATAAGLGIAFVVAGAALLDPSLPTVVKVVIAIALQLSTSVVGGMAIGRAALISGHSFTSATDTADLSGQRESD